MPAKKHRSARPIVSADPQPEAIAERAYHKWIARGCPTSDGLEDWFAAQTELQCESGKRSARGPKSAHA